MVKLEKYNPKKTYIFNTGQLATPEVVQAEYPACMITTFIVGTDEAGEVFGSFDSLNKIRTMYNIDPALTEDEAIQAIEDIMNTPPVEKEVDTTPSPEERIAAALEYQNLMAMEDIEA